MVDRYISADDLKDYLELGELDEDNYPKLSQVESWCTQAEEELDLLTNKRWDSIPNVELVSPTLGTNEFILKNKPIISISSIEYNTGNEWSPTWVSMSSSDYKIDNANISKIKTKNYFSQKDSLRVTYTSGYLTIPELVKRACLLLAEKRYMMRQLGIGNSDSEVISIANIRISDKTSTVLKYKVDGLDQDIKDTLSLLGTSMRVGNFNIGCLSNEVPLSKRYRQLED